MENPEETLQILERFTKLKQKNIPKELDEYIAFVAKTGDTVYRWPILKYLFREKLANVISEFYDFNPSIDGLPQYPNVDPFNYEAMKKMILDRFETFNAAPFTVQRICELLTEPRRQYTRVDKFMRAIEKNILVVSTQEPGRKRADSETNDSFDTIIYGGDLSSEVNVDIEMDGDFCLPSAELVVTDEIASTSHVTPSSKEPINDQSKGDAEKKATDLDAAAQPDDEAEKALERIGTEIEEKIGDKLENSDKSQHTETELLQSIIETAKAADLDVVEGDDTHEISHVKKLEHEIEKIDAPQVEVLPTEMDDTLKVCQTSSAAASPKRERETDDVEDSVEQEMVEQSPKKAKLDIEEAVAHEMPDNGKPAPESEKTETAPEVVETPDTEEASATTTVGDSTDSPSPSSSVEANVPEDPQTVVVSSVEEQSPETAVDDKSTNVMVTFAVSEPEVGEPEKESVGVDRTTAEPDLLVVEAPKSQEPIPVIASETTIPPVEVTHTENSTELTTAPPQVVTIEVHREPEPEKLVAELVELPPAEDSVEMDIIPPTMEVIASSEITLPLPSAAHGNDVIDAVNVMATDEEAAVVANTAESEMPTTGGKPDDHAMDIDETSSGASGEPMEDQ